MRISRFAAERRRQPRYALSSTRLSGLLTTAVGAHAKFEVRKISATGVCLRVGTRAEPGDTVVFALSYPNFALLEGEVAWCARSTEANRFDIGIHVTGNREGLNSLLQDLTH